MKKKEAYDFLCRLAEGIAIMFGKNCETVIHEVKDGKLWTIKSFNGHVSGRKAMTTQGILGGTLADEDIAYDMLVTDACNQLVVHPSGKLIKSSTFFLKGADYTYALGINYDITVMNQMGNILDSLTQSNASLSNTLTGKNETSGMEGILQECLKIINRPVEKMNKEDRINLIRLLDERKYFDMHKSVPYLAEQIAVSKYSIYKYLKEL